MRILGMDIGTKRIGIAMSDELLITAQALRTLERSTPEKDMEKINELIAAYSVREIVIGLPLHMNGTETPKTREVKEFAEFLKAHSTGGLPVTMWDERLTSVQAEKILLEADTSRRRRRAVIDNVAAQLMLQSYLDRKGAQ